MAAAQRAQNLTGQQAGSGFDDRRGAHWLRAGVKALAASGCLRAQGCFSLQAPAEPLCAARKSQLLLQQGCAQSFTSLLHILSGMQLNGMAVLAGRRRLWSPCAKQRPVQGKAGRSSQLSQ